MFNKEQLFQQILKQARSLTVAQPGDQQLGYLQDLPGTWSNLPGLPGRGWNFIALPFFDKDPKKNINYRLLMNQYNEEFKFTNVGKGIPNRGITRAKKGDQIGHVNGNKDQFVTALDYEQSINQIAVDDFPKTNLGGGKGDPIHHEPGLFLQMLNETTNNWEIARLASIPHGNSVLALGEAKVIEGPPTIPHASGLPIGLANNDIEQSKYLSPYKHYSEKPFRGIFNPLEANALLREANRGVEIKRTVELKFDTTFGTGGILNIPFIKRQADATEMHSTFWIQELAEKGADGKPKMRLQYTQTVFLDFFDRTDGHPVKIRWPHISINTLDKVSDTVMA